MRDLTSPSRLQHMVQSIDVHVPSRLRILFPNGGQNSCQVEHCVDFMLVDHSVNGLLIRDI